MRSLLLLATALTLAAQTPAGNADNGKRLFKQDGCYECHGYNGQGGRDGARIGPPVLNLQGLIRYVRKPAGAMPAFTEKVVTDQDLTDIYTYLKTIPMPKPVDQIPLLKDLKR